MNDGKQRQEDLAKLSPSGNNLASTLCLWKLWPSNGLGGLAHRWPGHEARSLRWAAAPYLNALALPRIMRAT